jgi:hypothetical protein
VPAGSSPVRLIDTVEQGACGTGIPVAIDEKCSTFSTQASVRSSRGWAAIATLQLEGDR